EQQNHIFDAYSQADQSISQKFGGTGLGMNITKQIIERMNGTITVKSQIGKGSVFAISIPIKIPQAVNSTQDPSEELFSLILDSAAPKEIEYSDLNILVVDDNATNHLVLNSLLDSVVSNIFRANNGQEAIQVLNSTDIDIVLMDIHMPVMDGIEATIAIRATEKPWKDVLIVALTADPQYQQKKLCINIGMDDALAKPVKLNDLRGAIDNVLKIREQRSLNKQSLAQTA
ncbi:MAG: ATP-binding response regulator, partial [Maricaulaceae bacterium]